MAERELPPRWRVYYEEWEYGCCGTAFRVGDEVTWPLALEDLTDDGRATWEDHLTELDPDLLPALRRTAVERAPVSPPKGARLHGLVRVDRHETAGGEGQRVTARIRAIEAVTLAWRRDPPGSRTLAPVPGRLRLHPVDDSETTAISPEAPGGGRSGVDGWLITLEPVGDGTPRPAPGRRRPRGGRRGRR